MLNLKSALTIFLDHRREVRSSEGSVLIFAKSEARAHILEGLRIAIDNIDEVVHIIRSSASPDEAKTRLGERFGLDDIQARAILDMRLQRLTGLQREEIETEYNGLLKNISWYKTMPLRRERAQGRHP